MYSLHARNPLLADFLQARVQDRLRAEWAGVMAEIEARRDAAMRAEDHLEVARGRRRGGAAVRSECTAD